MTEQLMVHGPTVWSGSTLEERDWLVPLEQGWLGSLEAVSLVRRAAERSSGGATPEDYRMPELEPLAERVETALANGPGVVVLRGWRVAQWGKEATSLLCLGFASLLGAPRPQDARGGWLHQVRDAKAGTSGASRSPRGGMTSRELALHTDRAHRLGLPRRLGLLCVRPAAKGGESLIVSGHTVHNRLRQRHPDLLARLYQDFHFGRGSGAGGEGVETEAGPVFQWRDGRLSVCYNRHWIERGHEAAGKPLSATARAALDAFDEALADPELLLRFPLLQGDLLLVDNSVLLHGRTAFVDHEEPQARRCLVRLWLD